MLLVASADHHGAVGPEPVLDLDHLARSRRARAPPRRSGPRSGSPGRPDTSLSSSRSGAGIHAHLPAGGDHVDRAVLVAPDVHAERGRRLGELLDLLGERLDPLLLVAQGVGELLVLADGPRERSRVSRSFSSRSFTWRGALVRRRRSRPTSSSRNLICVCSSWICFSRCSACSRLSAIPSTSALGSRCYSRHQLASRELLLVDTAGSPRPPMPGNQVLPRMLVPRPDTGQCQEPGVPDHPVVGPDAPLRHVPPALEHLERLDVEEARRRAAPGRAAGPGSWSAGRHTGRPPARAPRAAPPGAPTARGDPGPRDRTAPRGWPPR